MKIPYRYPVYEIDMCPLSKSAWETRSRSLNCSNDLTNMNKYFCMPNNQLTSLVEFCYVDTIRPMVEKDNCIVLAGSGTIDYRGCLNFNDGCPTDSYFSDTIYKYPKCLDVNGRKSCFTAIPGCNDSHATYPETTSFYQRHISSTQTSFVNANNSFSTVLANTSHTSDSGDTDNHVALGIAVAITLLVIIFFISAIYYMFVRRRLHNLWCFTKGQQVTRSDDEERVQFLAQENTDEKVDANIAPEKASKSNGEPTASDISVSESETFLCSTGLSIRMQTLFSSKNIVLITGGSGSGKTSTMWHIAHNLQHEGYKVNEINSLQEISSSKNMKYELFLCDDAFGTFNLDWDLLQGLDRSDDVEYMLCNNAKLICTCRLNIYRMLKNWKMCKYINVIDLEHEDYKLDINKRKQLLQNVCEKKNIPLPSYVFQAPKLMEAYNFAYLCHLFSEIIEFQEERYHFFENPLESIIRLFDEKWSTNKVVYAALICCIFPRSQHADGEDLFQTIKKNCKLASQVTIDDIKQEMHSLNPLVTMKNGTYCLMDKLLYEAVAYHYGNISPEDLLIDIDSNFLAGKIRIARDKVNVSSDMFIPLADSHLIVLAKRLYEDIELLLPHNVFLHTCWSDSEFVGAFVKLISEESDELLKNMFLEQTNIPETLFYDLPQNQRKKDAKNLENHTWYFQKLLEKRLEDYRNNEQIQYSKSIKILSWVIGYGQKRLLKFFINRFKQTQRELKLMFGSDNIEQSRLLVLACWSECSNTVELVIEHFNQSYIDSTCYDTNSIVEKKGCALNIHRKFTPLTAACFINQLSIVKLILGKGANINKRDDNGNLALTLSSRFGSFSLVEYLISKEASVDIQDEWGRSALICAAESGNSEITEFLIKHSSDVNACDNYGQSSLYRASKKEHLNIVSLLLNNNANVNLCDNDEKSPLYWSSQKGNIEIAKILINSGADVDKCDSKDKSPLYCAAKRGFQDMVDYLIENRADVNKCSKRKRSPVFRASKRGYLNVVRTLVQNKADLNIFDYKDKTPLYCASKRGHADIVNFLLQEGAYVDIRNQRHQTALYWASQKGHFEIVNILVQHKAEVNAMDTRNKSPLYCASKRGYLKIVEYLLKKDAKINSCNKKGKSSLYRASKRGHFDVVRHLVAHKADVNQCDKDGDSPLYWASKRGHLEIVMFLVENGAEVNMCNSNDCTSLYAASKNGHTEVVRFLCKKGANVNIIDKHHQSPLKVAERMGYQQIIAILKQSGAK